MPETKKPGRNDDRKAASHVPAQPPADDPILSDDEVTRRTLLLARLQAEFAAIGIRAVLARNHLLVLRYRQSPLAPSGQTDPRLHVMLPDGTRTATTDGSSYHTDDGARYPVTDPAAAVTQIRQPQTAESPA
jgi:hypothetical protein